jgi:hypothetical protein
MKGEPYIREYDSSAEPYFRIRDSTPDETRHFLKTGLKERLFYFDRTEADVLDCLQTDHGEEEDFILAIRKLFKKKRKSIKKTARKLIKLHGGHNG